VTARPRIVTDTDVALLRSLGRERSVVAASRAVGISRDRATYRLGRLERAFGGPVVTSVRGGRGHGATRLTPLGDRIVREGFDSVELLAAQPVAPPSIPNLLEGTYRGRPTPRIVLDGGLELRVAFEADEGEPVSVALDPEAILLACGRFSSSARNVLGAEVVAVRRRRPTADSTVAVRVGRYRLRVAVTPEPVRELGLVPGARVYLYVKATALRRVGRPRPGTTRGSPRS